MANQRKGPMYACFAFFPDGSVKRWKYVTNLKSFAAFLSRDHATWKYFNVYEKGSKAYLRRFYPSQAVPRTLALLLMVGLFSLTIRNQTFASPSTFKQGAQHPPMKNTLALPTTFKQATFINDFNNHATILTQGGTHV